jgi:hypothetical protein
MTPQTHNTSSRTEHSPRLVLISAEPDPPQDQQPVRIMGSEPRLTGNFCLTDR